MRQTALLALILSGCSGIRVLYPGEKPEGEEETTGDVPQPGETETNEGQPTTEADLAASGQSLTLAPIWGLSASPDDAQGLGTGAIAQFRTSDADWVAVGLPEGGGAVTIFPWGEPIVHPISEAQARYEGTGSSGVGSQLAVLWEGEHPVWLAVGAPYHQGKGAVFLLPIDPLPHSPEEFSEDHTLEGDSGGDLAGSRLLSWDMDADGTADLIVASVGVSQERGEVHVLHPEDFDEADALKDGEGMRGDNRGDRLGSSIAAGDVDGDGRAELLVCAPGWTDALVAQGACILTNPAADDEMEFEGLRGGGQPLLMGATTNAEIGESAALLADLDGDGRAEILVGSPGEGEVSLWWGGEIPLIGSTEDAALHIDGGEGTGTELFATPDALWVMTRDGIREFVDLPASGTVSATTGERLHFPRAHRPGEGRTTYGDGANPGLFFGFPDKTIGVHGYPVDTP